MLTKKTIKQVFKLALRILVTTLLLWLVLSRVNLQQLLSTVKTVRWELLVVIWLLAVLAFWIRSIKLRLILKKQQCNVNTAKLFSASAVTSLYSLVMPGLLSTGVKWYILKQHTGKGSNVLSSMAYNQITDIVARVLLGLVAIIIANPSQKWELPAICITAAIIIIISCILLLSRQTGTKTVAATRYALRAMPRIIRSPAETILEQAQVFQTTGWGFHLLIMAINLGVGFLGIVIYICAAATAGISVPPIALAWQSSAVYVLSRLPISIANLGVREFTLTEFLALYKIEPPAVLLMSMIIFSTYLFMAAIGACYQVNWAIKTKKHL